MKKQNDGWIHREFRLPAETDADADGRIMAWHVYQGAMLVRWNEFCKNAFNVCWMRISSCASPWIKSTDRPPTKADSDALNCVLAKNCHDEISIAGFHQFEFHRDLTHWKPLPAPPNKEAALKQQKKCP